MGQASRTALSPQAQTAPHYEAGCSCVPLTIKAMVYSTCLNGVLIIRGRTQGPTASVLKKSPLIRPNKIPQPPILPIHKTPPLKPLQA